eukprot:gene1749-4862_t
MDEYTDNDKGNQTSHHEAPTKWDLFRDSPLRYLGYTNELGESFKMFIPKYLYIGTYAVSGGYALVIIPGFTINRIVATTRRILQGRYAQHTVLRFAPTLAGILAIPFIIKPIDKLVDNAMDAVVRPFIRRGIDFGCSEGASSVQEDSPLDTSPIVFPFKVTTSAHLRLTLPLEDGQSIMQADTSANRVQSSSRHRIDSSLYSNQVESNSCPSDQRVQTHTNPVDLLTSTYVADIDTKLIDLNSPVEIHSSGMGFGASTCIWKRKFLQLV